METISRHFKKIEDKLENEKFQVKNIDFIYLINLDTRPDRWNRCLRQFAPFQIRPHRVAGIDGWKLSQEVFNDIAMEARPPMEYDQTVQLSFVVGGAPGKPFNESIYGKRCLHGSAPGGGMGGCLAHLSILNDAYLAGYQNVWVMEDDITVKGNPHHLAEYLDRLDQCAPGWDVLYTDDDCYYTAHNVRSHCGSAQWLRPGMPMTEALIERKAVGSDFFKIGGRTQAHSYIVSRSGLEKILRFVKSSNLFFPFDTELPCIEGLTLYNLRYDLVHGRDRQYSDTYFKRSP